MLPHVQHSRRSRGDFGDRTRGRDRPRAGASRGNREVVGGSTKYRSCDLVGKVLRTRARPREEAEVKRDAVAGGVKLSTETPTLISWRLTQAECDDVTVEGTSFENLMV